MRRAPANHRQQSARKASALGGAEASTAAKAAGLSYVTDDQSGFTRHANGKSVIYRGLDGRTIKDRETLARIKRLAIPPAWTEVWICPQANGHIQATGRDARGRKQYRYHPDWSSVRDGAKFERMIAFGKKLPHIRRRVTRDLSRRKLDQRKVLAAMVRLLETTLVRIGNEEYAKQNQSFGLSTMRDRHVRIGSGKLRFEFRGKSGKNHEIDLHDPRLAAIVRQTQDLPGQDLFQYLDDNDEPQKVGSADVNAYLREIAGEEFSAKDFRTWAGTVLAAVVLREFEKFNTKSEAKKNLTKAIERVAKRLGNTPAICRKCYIHPVVMESYLDGKTLERIETRADEAFNGGLAKLNAEEQAVLQFLKLRLRQNGRAQRDDQLGEALRRSLKLKRRDRPGAPGTAARRQ